MSRCPCREDARMQTMILLTCPTGGWGGLLPNECSRRRRRHIHLAVTTVTRRKQRRPLQIPHSRTLHCRRCRENMRKIKLQCANTQASGDGDSISGGGIFAHIEVGDALSVITSVLRGILKHRGELCHCHGCPSNACAAVGPGDVSFLILYIAKHICRGLFC